MTRNLLSISCALSAFALLGTACGDDGGSDAEGPKASGDADVVVVATDLAFDAETYTAEEGSVTIEYIQDGQVPHTLVIEDKSNFKLSVNGEERDTGDVLLEAGDYTIYCDIPGHRQAGMEATLTVE